MSLLYPIYDPIVDRFHINYITDYTIPILFCVVSRAAGEHYFLYSFYVIKHYCDQLHSSPLFLPKIIFLPPSILTGSSQDPPRILPKLPPQIPLQDFSDSSKIISLSSLYTPLLIVLKEFIIPHI